MYINRNGNNKAFDTHNNGESSVEAAKKIAVNRAIEEVNLNTPDSIGLAIETLKSKQIAVPQPLKELHTLHEKFPRGRDGNFAQNSNELQIQALDSLNNLL